MKHRMLILTAAFASATLALATMATPAAVESAVAESPTTGIASWLGDDAVSVVPDLIYGTAPDGTPLTLDVCLPAVEAGTVDTDGTVDADGTEAAQADGDAVPATATDGGNSGVGDADGDAVLRPAVLEIHGGGWSRGDKAEPEWRLACQWLASEGFVTVNVNYRLAPDAVFPAAIDDVTAALRWLRSPDVAERFAIDPERVGAFGGSAGGNLAALLGTRGTGDWSGEGRVAAVATVSGPMDLTAYGQTLGAYPDWLTVRELMYLDCTDFAECPAATDASPISFVDATDPPVFVAQSAEEFVPLGQSQTFVDELAAAGVEHVLQVDSGIEHSTAALDESLRTRITNFLHDALR